MSYWDFEYLGFMVRADSPGRSGTAANASDDWARSADPGGRQPATTIDSSVTSPNVFKRWIISPRTRVRRRVFHRGGPNGPHSGPYVVGGGGGFLPRLFPSLAGAALFSSDAAFFASDGLPAASFTSLGGDTGFGVVSSFSFRRIASVVCCNSCCDNPRTI